MQGQENYYTKSCRVSACMLAQLARQDPLRMHIL